MTILEQQGAAAKQAARKLAIAGTAKKNEALEAIARALEVGAPQWLAANAEDMKEAEANGMRPAMLDRLRLTEQRVADIVAAVRQELRNIAMICDAAEEPTQGDMQDKQAAEPEKAGEAK